MADEYIRRHLSSDTVNKQNSSLKILRVYDVHRKTNTVSPDVKKYCLLSANTQSFVAPQKSDIQENQIIVVTLVGSLVLTTLDVHRLFTHIFIDEAAQVDECQAWMPLSLANNKTCIVLAGDHKQMVQKVYSTEARQRKFELSIVERLINHYDGQIAQVVKICILCQVFCHTLCLN